MVFPWIPFPDDIDDNADTGDGMADSYFPVIRYIGNTSTTDDVVNVGVNDLDTVKYLFAGADITEGSVLSAHDESDTNYQNTTGFDAIAVLILNARSTGTATRHIKVYSSTTVDTADGTLVFETGQSDTAYFDSSSDFLTTPPLKIANNGFITIENVDDSRAGTNNVRVHGIADARSSVVVERGA